MSKLQLETFICVAVFQGFRGPRVRLRRREHLIRIGTSLMTPGKFLMDLWLKIHTRLPDVRFKLVPFENTPEKIIAGTRFGET